MQTPPPTQPVYNQHPDDLIKTVEPKPADKPAAPSAEETAKEEQTLEELKKQIPSLLFGEKKKEPEAGKEPEKKDGEVKPEAGKEPEKKEEPKKTKIKKAVDPLEVARETGKAIAESLKTVVVAPVPLEPEKVDQSAGMSNDDRDTYELFKVLAESEPQRYKNAHGEFANFVKKLDKYKRTWSKENPNTEFDPADEAHADFYDTNQPAFNVADLDKARVRLESRREVERALGEQRKEYDARVEEIENKAVVPEIVRQATLLSDHAVGKFINGIPDETLKKAASEDSNKLKDSDPLAFDILNGEAGLLREQVAELHNIVERGSKYYKEHNPVHKGLAQFVNSQERAIKQLPSAQQQFEGKQFSSRQDYQAMTPAQRNSHWILSEDDVVDMLTSQSVGRAMRILESEKARMKTMAEKYGFTAPTGTQGKIEVKQNNSEPPKKIVSPAAPSGGALPPTNSPSNQAIDTPEKKLVKMLF